MLKLIEVINSEQLINDNNIVFNSKYKGREYMILDFLSKYKKQFFNLILKAFMETNKIKESTKNKLKLYFNLE